MCRLTANAKTTKTHRNEVGFVVFWGISMRTPSSKRPIFSPFRKKCKGFAKDEKTHLMDYQYFTMCFAFLHFAFCILHLCGIPPAF